VQELKRSDTGEKKALSKKEKKKELRQLKRKETHGFTVEDQAAKITAGTNGWDVFASSGNTTRRALSINRFHPV
jgi:hypothetical protein